MEVEVGKKKKERKRSKLTFSLHLGSCRRDTGPSQKLPRRSAWRRTRWRCERVSKRRKEEDEEVGDEGNKKNSFCSDIINVSVGTSFSSTAEAT